jgi:hypothetical protein
VAFPAASGLGTLTKPLKSVPADGEAADGEERGVYVSTLFVAYAYHVLRHSSVSVLVTDNVDQRIIDEWAGHSTEVRRRYTQLRRELRDELLNRELFLSVTTANLVEDQLS